MDTRATPSRPAPSAAAPAKRFRAAKVLTAEMVLDRLAAFVAAHGRMPTTREDQVLDRKLNEMRRGRARLAPEIVARLEATPHWRWTKAEQTPAEIAAQRLADFVAEHGRPPAKTRRGPADETNFATLLAKYRRNYARLAPRDRAAFEAVPGWTWNVPAPPTLPAAPAPAPRKAARRSPAAAAATASASPSASPAAKVARRASPGSPAIARLRTEDLPSPSAYASASRPGSRPSRLSRSFGSSLLGSLGASPSPRTASR